MPEDGRARPGGPEVVQEAFEDLPLAVCVIDGPEHRFTAVNAAHRALLGRSDLLGERMVDLFPDLAGQRIYEVAEQVYATGRPDTVHEWCVPGAPGGSGEPHEVFLDADIRPRFATDGTVRGVLCTTADATGRVLERRAVRAAAAAAEQRYEQTRDVLAELHRELLSGGLPVLPRLHVAASYLPADATAGGDWFDAVPLPEGRIGLVVGDVVGHGAAASAVMGQLRAVVGERLAAGATVPDVLAAVDAVADRLGGARATTVCVLVLDPEDGTATYCTAGHPPPLLVSATGPWRYLPRSGGGPLGVGSSFPTAEARFGVGDVVLLYTDGFLERPGWEAAAGSTVFAGVAVDALSEQGVRDGHAWPVERICARTLELLIRDSGYSDDSTVLAAQLVEPRPPLTTSWPAEVSAVALTRTALGAWLGDVGASQNDVMAVQHAVGELVTNSVEHAHPAAGPSGDDGQAVVFVDARLTSSGRVQVTVSDTGRWSARSGSTTPANDAFGRGRGLAMARELMDTLRIDRRAEGTRITVTRRLTRPARLTTAREIVSGARSPGSELLLILDQPVGQNTSRIRVDGPVDAETARQLHIELRRRTHGGSRRVTVDLTGVTHLASAGVAVLFEAIRMGDPATAPRLYAPTGSVAAHVLDLVALSHATHDVDVPSN